MWSFLSLVLGVLVPEKPAFLKVLKVDKDTVSLSWGLPKKLNGNLTRYLLQYQISTWVQCCVLIFYGCNFFLLGMRYHGG